MKLRYKAAAGAAAAAGIATVAGVLYASKPVNPPIPNSPAVNVSPTISPVDPDAPIDPPLLHVPSENIGNIGIVDGIKPEPSASKARPSPRVKYAIGTPWPGLEGFKEITAAGRNFALERVVLRNYFEASSIDELSDRMKSQYGLSARLPYGTEVKMPYKRSDAPGDFHYRTYFAQRKNEPLVNILRRALNAKINEVAQANGLISDVDGDSIKGDYVPRNRKIRLVGYYTNAAAPVSVASGSTLETKVAAEKVPSVQTPQYLPDTPDSRPIWERIPVPPMPNSDTNALSNEEFNRRTEELIKAVPVPPEPKYNGNDGTALKSQSNYIEKPAESAYPAGTEPFDVTKIVNVERIRKGLNEQYRRDYERKYGVPLPPDPIEPPKSHIEKVKPKTQGLRNDPVLMDAYKSLIKRYAA